MLRLCFFCILGAAAKQKQSLCQRVLRSGQRVRRQREGRAQLSVHRGEWRSCRSKTEVSTQHLLHSAPLCRAVNPTRGPCVAATARPTGITVSSTEMLVWPDWRSKWLTTDTARVNQMEMFMIWIFKKVFYNKIPLSQRWFQCKEMFTFPSFNHTLTYGGPHYQHWYVLSNIKKFDQLWLEVQF